MDTIIEILRMRTKDTIDDKDGEAIIQYANMILGMLANNHKDMQAKIVDTDAIAVIQAVMVNWLKSDTVIAWSLYSLLVRTYRTTLYESYSTAYSYTSIHTESFMRE